MSLGNELLNAFDYNVYQNVYQKFIKFKINLTTTVKLLSKILFTKPFDV